MSCSLNYFPLVVLTRLTADQAVLDRLEEEMTGRRQEEEYMKEIQHEEMEEDNLPQPATPSSPLCQQPSLGAARPPTKN